MKRVVPYKRQLIMEKLIRIHIPIFKEWNEKKCILSRV